MRKTATASDLVISIDQSHGDPFRVVVNDAAGAPLVEMSAITRHHAKQVAQSLAMLLSKMRPGQGVVLPSNGPAS